MQMREPISGLLDDAFESSDPGEELSFSVFTAGAKVCDGFRCSLFCGIGYSADREIETESDAGTVVVLGCDLGDLAVDLSEFDSDGAVFSFDFNGFSFGY